MKFELFYSGGGHGGPHPSLEAARDYAEKYLRGGKDAWVAIVPYDKMEEFDPKKPQTTAKTMVHRKDLGEKQAGYRGRGGGDPRWLRAKYPGIADDGTPFRKGDEVLYWPATKTFMVGKKAEDAWRKFEAETADEDFYRYASESERDLKHKLIRLAYDNPDLRADLLPILRSSKR